MGRQAASLLHYVYILYMPDGITPFYVGLGSNERWDDHEKYAKRGRKGYTYNVIRSITKDGSRLIKKKVAEGLSRPEAIELEIALIAQYGRRPLGLLTNRTKGGDGGCDDPEHKAAIARALTGRVRPQHERDKISKSTMGRKMSPESIAKSAAGNTGKKRSTATREKLRESHLGKKWTDASKAKRLATRAERNTDKIVSDALRGRKQSAEVVATRAAALKKLIGITDGISDRRIMPGVPLPDGWRYGRSYRLPPEVNLARGQRISATKRSKRCQAPKVRRRATSMQAEYTAQLSLTF